MLTEKHGKGTVAEIGAQRGARTSRKFEQHGDYIQLQTREGVQNRRPGESKGNIDWKTDLLEVRAKDPEASQLRTTVAAVTACGSSATTPTLVDCNSVNLPLKNSCNHATANFNTFRCPTECKSRYNL
jgi:hypothetical protein